MTTSTTFALDQPEVWKMKKMVLELGALKSFSSTSLISILIPPNTQLAKVSTMINGELATAESIKQRVNKNLVIKALKSVKERMKLVKQLPQNGLCLYYGTSDDGGKPLDHACLFEPIKPVPTFTYRCDNAFLTEVIENMFLSDDRYGFLVFDGNGVLFGLLNGNAHQVIYKLSVQLPKKHHKGGQSALRFARLRARHNYLTKVNELAMQHFIPLKPKGIFVGGSAMLKHELVDILDPPLRNIVMKVVDIAYGGMRGFLETIDAVKDVLAHAPIIRDRALISKFMEEIAKDTNKYAFGVNATLQALEMGVAESIIVWDSLPLVRYKISGPDGKDQVVVREPSKKIDKDATVNDAVSLVDWLVENAGKYGAELHMVTKASPEGSQFCMGFGGFGAILRYPMEIPDMEADLEAYLVDEDDEDSDEDPIGI